MQMGDHSSEPPRILHFAGQYLPVPGETTMRLRGMLGSHRYRRTIIHRYPSPSELPASIEAIPKHEMIEHVDVLRIQGKQSLFWTVPYFKKNIVWIRVFVQAARNCTCDIIHAHNPA